MQDTLKEKTPFVRNELFLFLEEKEMIIGPEMAKELLLKNYQNRPKNLNKVDYFVQVLKTGSWDKTKQPIEVLDDGRLIDGQHRLTAIYKTGISVPVSVKVLRLVGEKENGLE